MNIRNQVPLIFCFPSDLDMIPFGDFVAAAARSPNRKASVLLSAIHFFASKLDFFYVTSSSNKVYLKEEGSLSIYNSLTNLAG